jgi:hypothetical protein
LKTDRIRALNITIDEARFFFGKRERTLFQGISTAAENYFGHLGEREQCKDTDPKWSALGNVLANDISKLRQMYAELPADFEDALSFPHVTKSEHRKKADLTTA